MELIIQLHLKLGWRKRKNRMGCSVDDDWRKDAGEKAKRIWEWWKPIVVDDSNFS